MHPIKTLLVPTDFGEPAEAALAWAADLAEGLGARLFLLHTYQLPVIGFPDGMYVASDDEFATRMVAAANKALEDAIKTLNGRNIEVTPLVKAGDPREVILTTAKEVGANLIVMGTHGRRGISRALIGSVTESLVRTSTVPILTVHAPDPKA